MRLTSKCICTGITVALCISWVCRLTSRGFLRELRADKLPKSRENPLGDPHNGPREFIECSSDGFNRPKVKTDVRHIAAGTEDRLCENGLIRSEETTLVISRGKNGESNLMLDKLCGPNIWLRRRKLSRTLRLFSLPGRNSIILFE